MKVFVSWSGGLSRDIALALREWLPSVLPAVEPWVSTRDIKAGRNWAHEVKRYLDASDAGMICLTQENCARPWINFEAGALLYRLEHAPVLPILIDVDAEMLPATLGQLQALRLDRDGVLTLLGALNGLLQKSLDDSDLKDAFQPAWPNFDKRIRSIIKAAHQKEAAAQPERALQQIEQDYRKALAHPSAVFRRAVANEIFECATTASQRSNKILDSGVTNYKRLLIDLYSSAEVSVFSTSLPEYDVTWKSRLGDEIIEAHSRSKAAVTRVFVFETRDQVTEQHLALMKKQAQCPRINVRIYINQEDAIFEFSTNYSRDFTVIDSGAAIGLTQSYGLNCLRAIWHFGNMSLAGQLRAAQDALTHESTPLSKWPPPQPPR